MLRVSFKKEDHLISHMIKMEYPEIWSDTP